MVKPRRIADFKPTFTNLAQTSHYQLIFGGLPLGVRQHLNVRGVDYRFMTETSGLLCSSAVIPGSTLADTKVIGNYQGVIENMTHARIFPDIAPVSYTHLRAHETSQDLVCRLLLEKKKDFYPTLLSVFFQFLGLGE